MSKYSYILFATWVLLFFFSNGIGRFDGYFFPVVEGFAINKITPNNLIYGTFIKERDCDYVDIKWYQYENGKSTSVKVNVLEQSKIRPEGFHEYGPCQLNLDYTKILKTSYVEVYHRCNPFWTTITKVYP